MSVYKSMSGPGLTQTLITKLDGFWSKLSWWQKLILGKVYQEVRDMLEALKEKGYLSN